jgi:uncharacterized protein YaiE (UPF0345 family)
MSTIIAKNVQVGTSGTAAQNFTLYQPAAPDGTVRLANGNSGTTTDLVTVTSAGNVGIGTNAPAEKLHVDGAVRVTRSAYPFIEWQQTGSTGVGQVAMNGNTFEIRATTSNPLAFYTNNTERARIDSNGNLLVNRTSAYNDGSIGTPSLQVNGVVGARAAAAFISNGTGSVNIIGFVNPNGTVGAINVSGSGTTYVTSSDYRLKHDIQPMTGALAKVAALKPVTYKWNADDSQSQGFIAHELQEVVPECVTGEKDAVDTDGQPKYQGIDTSFLVATLTAAIQEQQAIIEQLKADVAALKAGQVPTETP